MHFASDNSGPVHPNVMEALVRANAGYAPAYGGETLAAEVTDRIREIFEAPEAAVYLVATGTAANALLLASHVSPWETVFCAETSHVNESELNAPEFYSDGAKLTLLPTVQGKITAETLETRLAQEQGKDLHAPEPGPVSITQVTERGTVYSLAELHALSEVTRGAGLKLHMDGARFANAQAQLGCTPAEATWKAGIDMLSFGGTKNGLMGVEAAILFDPAKAREFELRRKRGAHLFSKHRYLAAQMKAYLTDGLWLDMAAAANAACKRLADGLRRSPNAEILFPPDANMIFARLPRAVHRRLYAAGAEYHLEGASLDGGPEDEWLPARFVTDWSARDADTDRFLSVLAGAPRSAP